MQIKKETVISVLTTSGETINAGDTVIFNFDDKWVCTWDFQTVEP